MHVYTYVYKNKHYRCGQENAQRNPHIFQICSSSLLSSTIISMLQHNRWLSFIECKINEIYRGGPISKLAILKKAHPLMYKTNRNTSNSLPNYMLLSVMEWICHEFKGHTPSGKQVTIMGFIRKRKRNKGDLFFQLDNPSDDRICHHRLGCYTNARS